MQAVSNKDHQQAQYLSGAKPAFRYRQNIGKARHVISHHAGQKTHGDGSPFFDMTIFSRKTEAQKIIRALRSAGYTED